MAAQDTPDRLKRLSRIEGQVRGIAQMIQNEREPRDVLTQIQAVHAALRKVELALLRASLDDLVRVPVNDQEGRSKQLDEVTTLLDRFAR